MLIEARTANEHWVIVDLELHLVGKWPDGQPKYQLQGELIAHDPHCKLQDSFGCSSAGFQARLYRYNERRLCSVGGFVFESEQYGIGG